MTPEEKSSKRNGSPRKRLESLPPAYVSNIKLAIQLMREGLSNQEIKDRVGTYVLQDALEYRKWL
jgi:hypothetical protein